ncbi:MAG: YbaB/EbfC family nucleoid-associated protein [Magnetococcus sp. WYHC-3]
MGNIMKQAQQLQAQMNRLQQELAETTCTGGAGGGHGGGHGQRPT